MSRISRRGAPSEKERTPRSEKRTVLKDRAGSGFHASDRREEYRPAGLEQAAKKPDRYQQRPVRGKPDESKASLQATEKRRERPARSKPTYGRKPFHGRPTRSLPREGEKKRPEPEPKKTSGLPDQSADRDGSGAFIVPKFPKKILDELTTSDGEKKRLTSDLTDSGTERILRREGEEKQSTPAPSLPVEKDKDLSPTEKPEPPPSGDTFSRLDEMVMGDSLPSKAEEGTESPVPETETPKSEEKTEPAPLPSEADDTKEPASESTEGSHDRQATQESPDDGRDTRDESDKTDADSGESKPDDGDKQKKWGRPKRKKISR